MRVVRLCHAGRDPAHRLRDRALVAAGVELTYVVPDEWPEPAAQNELSEEPFRIVELPVRRAGDVNRHRYRAAAEVARIVDGADADLVDLLEEPFSSVTHQLLGALPRHLPVVVYASQNLDKRWPPPFAQWERQSFRRTRGIYPCSNQAASVMRGKGYGGLIQPIPLGYDADLFSAGDQAAADPEITLALVGRMVPEKGVRDAVRILTHVQERGPARLLLVGEGPEVEPARAYAESRGIGDRIEHLPWQSAADLARLYRSIHVVLAPSRSTRTWAEQFGRMISEGQASGCVVAGYISGAISEVGGEAAILVPEGDEEALAAAVLRLLADPEEYAERRWRGLRSSLARTWEAVASEQVHFYERALMEPPRPLGLGGPDALRAQAAAEFGPPAVSAGEARPFAVPFLRSPSPLSRGLGRLIDVGARLRASVASRRRG